MKNEAEKYLLDNNLLDLVINLHRSKGIKDRVHVSDAMQEYADQQSKVNKIEYCNCINQFPKPINDNDYECVNCGKEIKPLQSKVSELAIEALEKIVSPLRHLKNKAKKDGYIIDMNIANQLLATGNFYRDIAEKALNEIKSSQQKPADWDKEASQYASQQSKVSDEVISIVKGLAQWSTDYPLGGGRVYKTSKEVKMNADLIGLEERAKRIDYLKSKVKS